MKSAFLAISTFLLVAAVHGSAVLEARTQGNYVQPASGDASFSSYSGCGTPACGQAAASGYTAAMNLLSFGAPSGWGPGDACGRCFSITGTVDPNTGSLSSPPTIVVKVTDLCTDGQLCGQTLSNPINSLNQPIHFALCSDTGAAGSFLPSNGDSLIGTYQEVSCSQWSGSDGPASSSSCLAGETAGFWPSTACGNKGSAPA